MLDEPRWIVAPDEARIRIAVGPEANVSPQLHEALDQLARVPEQPHEVQGYRVCDKLACQSLYDCPVVV